MKLTFFSSVLGYHQEALANAFYDLLGDDFRFVAFSSLPEYRKTAGFQDLADIYPYVVKAYTDEGKMLAEDLMLKSDVAIVGATEHWVKRCCVENGAETYLFSERFFKKGAWRAFVPPIRKKVLDAAAGLKQSNFKVLCASAYLPYDLSLCGWHGKAYRWGYFPQVNTYDIDELLRQKQGENGKIMLLWAARLLEWKHPEKAIQLAYHLKKKGLPFHLNIIGYGKLEKTVCSQIRKQHLEDVVTFLGKRTPLEVRKEMEKADIFLMTSDYNEGWGVVVNESLNSGCAVIGDVSAGAVMYMIEDGKNGFTYKKTIETVYPVIEKMIEDGDFRKAIQKNAYEYMHQCASPQIAAKRFLQLVQGETFDSGICSEAPIIKSTWL